jgi:hypothetical protein
VGLVGAVAPLGMVEEAELLVAPEELVGVSYLLPLMKSLWRTQQVLGRLDKMERPV